MRNLSSPLIVILFLALIPLITEAATPLSVIINEIAWMGTAVGGVESKNWWRYEWLELYNNTNAPIPLDDWKIELYRIQLDWTLGLKGVIPAQGYFLIVASDKISPNYDLNYSNLSGKFINSGQKVLLKDGGGQIIDEIDCSSGWFAGDNTTKQTMERKNSLLISNFDNWTTSQNPDGTPKAENSEQGTINNEQKTENLTKSSSLPTPLETKEYPSGVIINEILPSPEGPDEEEEWIEIFNQNNFEVNLSNWQVADTIGSTNAYAFPEGTKISPQGFLVLSRPATKITLNNSGDGLNFLQPDGNIIDTITYEIAPRGQSYNRIDSQWVWSNILTPGSANIIPTLEEEKTEPKKVEVKPPEVEGSEVKKEIAAIGKQIPKETPSFPPLLIALAIAIFSGVIILLLKIKLPRNKNLLE